MNSINREEIYIYLPSYTLIDLSQVSSKNVEHWKCRMNQNTLQLFFFFKLSSLKLAEPLLIGYRFYVNHM